MTVLYMQVIWKVLYNNNSAKEKGTLCQLRNLINRTAIPLDCSKNVKVAEDFLRIVLHAYIVAAAHAIFKIHGAQNLQQLVGAIVQEYANFNIPDKKVPNESADKVLQYSSEVKTL